jgi:signal transduction histidine kinase
MRYGIRRRSVNELSRSPASTRSDRRRGGGRIGNTLLFNLAVIGVVAVSALFLLLSAMIDRTFDTLEGRELQAHLGRVADFQKSSLRSLTSRSKDWAVWDDSYHYAQDFNAAYEASNVNAESFHNALVDGLAIYRYDGGAARAFAFDRGSGEALPGLAATLKGWVTRPAFVQQVRARNGAQTFVTFGGELYGLAAVQLRRSDGGGATPGFLVFIDKIGNDKATQALQVATELDPAARVAATSIDKRADTIEVIAPFKGLDGHTVAALHLHLKRPLTAAANELLSITFGGVMAVILLLLVALGRRVRTLVLEPVERLHLHVSHIRETGELREMDAPAPANELGGLQDEFNHMTKELQGLRAQLESRSFTLGKSQSAVGLMHNLRNCLSPVRVILETLDQGSADPLPSHAPRALQELANETTPPERRAKLKEFLAAAHEHVGALHAMRHQQIREAARNLTNALDAIDLAGKDQRETRFDERCDLAGLLSHSGNIARYAENMTVAVDVRCDGYVAATGNRVLLSQVLENIVTNALEAIRESGREDGAISLQASQDPVSGTCTITVRDNGAGFAPDISERLFERGFSTRTSKSGGLGLHWCANTVRAMSGEFRLESDGKGTGARAFLHLPLWQDPDIPARDAA